MIAPARRTAVDALLQIEAEPIDLGEAIARARRTLSDARDRALLLELVSGTLRMRGAIDYQLALRVNRPLPRLDAAVLCILRMSAYQLLYSSRLPVPSIINDAVELTRRAGKSSAAGLVNAVLRGLSRDRDRLTWPDDLSIVHSHPQWLVDRWIARFGAEAVEAWLRFNNRAAPLCLAANRLLTTREALAEELLRAGVTTRPTPRAANGLYVTGGHPLELAAFSEGRFVVQDEASQLIAELASPADGARVLDLCASPGGKTVALAAGAGARGHVVASDVRPHRMRLLAKTLERCRIPADIVRIGADGPLPFLAESFDTVVIDAPCSGLGTVRRDPDIKWRRSPADLERFAGTQRAMMARAAGLVRRGGTLVYSTCSSEPEENADVVNAFLEARADYRLERQHETLPFRDGLEAFYGAVLRRVEL
jgi:16S rRNA (cytosine967-C5)-methyltransferase